MISPLKISENTVINILKPLDDLNNSRSVRVVGHYFLQSLIGSIGDLSISLLRLVTKLYAVHSTYIGCSKRPRRSHRPHKHFASEIDKMDKVLLCNQSVNFESEISFFDFDKCNKFCLSPKWGIWLTFGHHCNESNGFSSSKLW